MGDNLTELPYHFISTKEIPCRVESEIHQSIRTNQRSCWRVNSSLAKQMDILLGSLTENKTNLVCFQYRHILENTHRNEVFVDAGRFRKQDEFDIIIPPRIYNSFKHSTKKQKLWLYSVPFTPLQIVLNDTYILILLTAHFAAMRCNMLWMKASTPQEAKIHHCSQQCRKHYWNQSSLSCI